jgi:hypothetical protein
MKRNYFMLIGTLFLLLVVCEKEMADQKRCLRFMEKNSKSITILQVNSNSKFIDLTGEINLSDNEIEFRLLNENRTFYAIRFHSIDTFSVDGTFCTNPGFRQIESSSFDCIFAMLLILFALRGGLGKPHFSSPDSNRNE